MSSEVPPVSTLSFDVPLVVVEWVLHTGRLWSIPPAMNASTLNSLLIRFAIS